jgi:S1-C subfamily serine protease
MQAAFLAGVGIMAAHEGSLGQVMVVGVSEGHAAHQAGIDIGDEIIAIDGQQVRCPGVLRSTHVPRTQVPAISSV